MKLTLVIILALCFAYANCELTLEEADEKFKDYLNEFKIRLGRSDDAIVRAKKNFVYHYNQVEEHNKDFREGKVPYELGISPLSYLSYDEFLPQWTGLLETNESEGIPYEPENRRGARAEVVNFSWLNTPGVVQPVQNQGGCGSCWAFGGVGALEGQLAINKGISVKLSEQEVIECGVNPWAGNLLGCNGGWHFGVYNFAKNYNGVAAQSIKPYRGNTYSACRPLANRVTAARTMGYTEIYSRNEEEIKQALLTKGPLYVTFYVSSDFYSYRSGVYTDRYSYCNGNPNNNHGVLLVGFGVENNIPYWQVKNSWGTSFGQSGYFKIQRGRNLCGIATCVNYPVLWP